MSLKQLEKAILEEAAKQSQAVADDFYEQLATEESRIKEKAQIMEEHIIEQGAVKGKEEAKRLHQESALHMRALVLLAKQKELDKTKQVLKEELLSKDESKIKTLLEKLIRHIPEEKGNVILGDYHATMLKKMIKNPHVTIQETTIPQEGGFIYQNDTIELNFTVTKLVDDLFNRHRIDIAKTLFE